MGPKIYPETSLTDHQTTPRNITEERRPQRQDGGSLNSHSLIVLYTAAERADSLHFDFSNSNDTNEEIFISK
jgi:hypothetical protein